MDCKGGAIKAPGPYPMWPYWSQGLQLGFPRPTLCILSQTGLLCNTGRIPGVQTCFSDSLAQYQWSKAASSLRTHLCWGQTETGLLHAIFLYQINWNFLLLLLLQIQCGNTSGQCSLGRSRGLSATVLLWSSLAGLSNLSN